MNKNNKVGGEKKTKDYRQVKDQATADNYNFFFLNDCKKDFHSVYEKMRSVKFHFLVSKFVVSINSSVMSFSYPGGNNCKKVILRGI